MRKLNKLPNIHDKKDDKDKERRKKEMLMMKIVLQLRNVALVFTYMRTVTGTSNLKLYPY